VRQYHIVQYGQPELPIILFLHGFMGSSDDFWPLLTQLSKNFHCVCVDLPGHGQTASASDDIPSIARQLVELLASLLIDRPCYLFGYSLGGRIALYLTLHYPQYWRKVVLESASAGLANPTAQQERQRQDQAIARKLRQPHLDFAEFIDHWYQQPVFQGINAHPNFPALIAQRLQNQSIALAQSLENTGLGSQPYLGQLLSNNQIPLLLMAGVNDDKFVDINQAMAASCPAAELLIVPNCSHNIHWQQPQQWSQSLQAWFN
jgi:2-succinyl-6-hydroxy-2,4-cyclohexadiene-1-carboxylate synthase